jgi:serine protease Do
MKRTHSAYRSLTILAWLTAFCCSPAFTYAASTEAAQSSSPLNYTFDDTPLDRSNQDRPTSYSDMLDKVTPAVVEVNPSRSSLSSRGRNPRLQQYLQRLYGGNQPPADWTDAKGTNYWYIGTGSGCIISSDGYILTNNHVVDNENDQPADAILVKLSDGRELQAKVIGTDKETDLALIKIDARDLPTIKLTDSEKLRVGDIVFAVGNPMDVGTTVTHGIISALGRSDLGLLDDDNSQTAGFEDFIQTDASINPGNSGGPLVDAEGRLVGLNSVIESPSGGSIGIGFAIPSSLARHVADDLIKNGKVRRSALGVKPTDVDHNLAQALHLPNTRGALVNEVTAGSPADKSGLRPDDVVVKINNDEVDSAGKLRYLVGLSDPGTTVNVTVFRNGQPQVVKVLLQDRDQVFQEANGLAPVRNATAGSSSPTANNVPASGEVLTGLALTPLTAALRQNLQLPKGINGLVVDDVADGSPYGYDFQTGTVIMQVNQQPVATVEDLRAALKPGQINLFYVFRKDDSGNEHAAIVTHFVPGAAR